MTDAPSQPKPSKAQQEHDKEQASTETPEVERTSLGVRPIDVSPRDIPEEGQEEGTLTEGQVRLAQMGLPGHPGTHLLDSLDEEVDSELIEGMQPFDTSNDLLGSGEEPETEKNKPGNPQAGNLQGRAKQDKDIHVQGEVEGTVHEKDKAK